DVALQLGSWGARWLELAPQDYDPFVVLWAWKMHVVLDRLPQPRIVIGFDLRDRPKERFWLLLQQPEAELGVKHPGYDEDLVITTDSRTLTLVHLGRVAVADAERGGAWRVDGPPWCEACRPGAGSTAPSPASGPCEAPRGLPQGQGSPNAQSRRE